MSSAVTQSFKVHGSCDVFLIATCNGLIPMCIKNKINAGNKLACLTHWWERDMQKDVKMSPLLLFSRKAPEVLALTTRRLTKTRGVGGTIPRPIRLISRRPWTAEQLNGWGPRHEVDCDFSVKFESRNSHKFDKNGALFPHKTMTPSLFKNEPDSLWNARRTKNYRSCTDSSSSFQKNKRTSVQGLFLFG